MNKIQTINLVTIEFPPENFFINNKVEGVSVDIVTEIMKRIGYKVNIKILPFERAKREASIGKVDGIFTITKNKWRKSVFYFPENQLTYVVDVFFKRKNMNIFWNNTSELKKYSVSYTKGYSYNPVFLNMLKVKAFRSQESILGATPELRHLERLIRGYTDLFICETNVCSYLVNKFPERFSNIDFIPKLIGEEVKHYLALSKKFPGAKELLILFDKEYLKLKNEGRLEKIYTKWKWIQQKNISQRISL